MRHPSGSYAYSFKDLTKKMIFATDAEIGPSTFKSFVSVAATNFDYLHSQVEVETVSSGQKKPGPKSDQESWQKKRPKICPKKA